MIKITVIAIGTLKEKFDQLALQEYVKRLSTLCKLDVVELTECKLPNSPSEKQIALAKQDETERQLSRIPNGAQVIVLDSRGQQVSSPELSSKFNEWTTQGASHFVFLIGGSHGLSSSIETIPHWKWSFSMLTFTHQMIRIMLLEQIYRSFKIMRGEPYHK
jgi:23S rRNA (pseudouridine1915-N3)-methyltransferase